MGFFRQSLRASHIARSAPAIFASVAVEKFLPIAARRNANQVSHSGHRREIAYDEHRVFAGLTFAQQRDDARWCVIAVHPFETLGIVVKPVQWRFAAIRTVELFEPV